jgi:hypothetical protein
MRFDEAKIIKYEGKQSGYIKMNGESVCNKSKLHTHEM